MIRAHYEFTHASGSGGAILLLAAGWVFTRDGKEDTPGETPPPQAASGPLASRPATSSRTTPRDPQATTPANPKLTDEERVAILGKIEEASVTYDAKALPEIEPFLLHPDPEVRTAALNGMIVLGEAGAAPLLRKAAETAPTPQEAVAMTEAAGYLELPSGTFVPKDRTAPGTRLPGGDKAPERRRPKGPPVSEDGDDPK
ncbi:HEAT repeat domain-containing protein [Luteolibacter sp. Populi]|uniref:HEAT repeat domain-containing protein n=1 Tax=Luteolibacter sp. Populi TaxID=3230487 RepID=UPI0034651F9D